VVLRLGGGSKTDPRHFAPIASILGPTERLGFDRLALKVGFKLQDRGVRTFQVWDHLAELHAFVRFRPPGITGWAQVNGFRGETDTDEKMKRRVDHDHYDIDNCASCC
jgi:hypothetical protein